MAARYFGTNIQKNKINFNNLIIKTISIFFSVIILIFLTLSISFTYNHIILNENLNNLTNFKVLTIVGDSMKPQFNSGDLIIIKKVPINRIKVGDIISFYKESIVVTHRVAQIQGNRFVTIGDDNLSNDKILIDSTHILGKYIIRIPKGDYFLSICTNPFFVFIIFLLLLVNISFLVKIFTKSR